MTCQWCIHFRYKSGASACARPGGDGKTIPAKGRSSECSWFSPRRTCTTCGHRCDPDEREALCADGRTCDKWILRSISKWGGCRRSQSSRTSEDSSTTTRTTEGANT